MKLSYCPRVFYIVVGRIETEARVGQSTAYWRSNLYMDAEAEPAPSAPYRDLPKNQANRFKLLRKGLLAQSGVSERIRFMGDKWRWAWEYGLGSRKLCWLHAMSSGVGATFTLTDHESREVQALSRVPAVIAKAIRDGQQTGPVRWCSLDINDQRAAEAFLAFTKKKIGWLKAETPTLVVRRSSRK